MPSHQIIPAQVIFQQDAVNGQRQINVGGRLRQRRRMLSAEQHVDSGQKRFWSTQQTSVDDANVQHLNTTFNIIRRPTCRTTSRWRYDNILNCRITSRN